MLGWSGARRRVRLPSLWLLATGVGSQVSGALPPERVGARGRGRRGAGAAPRQPGRPRSGLRAGWAEMRRPCDISWQPELPQVHLRLSGPWGDYRANILTVYFRRGVSRATLPTPRLGVRGVFSDRHFGTRSQHRIPRYAHTLCFWTVVQNKFLLTLLIPVDFSWACSTSLTIILSGRRPSGVCQFMPLEWISPPLCTLLAPPTLTLSTFLAKTISMQNLCPESSLGCFSNPSLEVPMVLMECL